MTAQPQLTQIVRAEAEHAFSLAALELQLNREQGLPGEPGFLERFADAWLSEYAARPTWIATALDGRPLGAVTLYVVPGLPRPGRARRSWVHVTNLYVTASARRSGLGERLMRAALAWCREQDVLYVQLKTTDAGAGLYRRLGFAPASSDWLRWDPADLV